MVSMSWSATLQVSGSPAVSVIRPPITVEAVDRIEAVIAPGEQDKAVAVQPGAIAAIHVLLVKSSLYSKNLSFKANDGATDSTAIVLDSPQLFSGGGLAAIKIAPRSLKFSNSGPDVATVEVIVVRNAN